MSLRVDLTSWPESGAAMRQLSAAVHNAGLVWTIATINTWNRVRIAARAPVGSYQPRSAVHA